MQARIPAALAAVHNFISIHNPHDEPISSTTPDHSHGNGAERMHDDNDHEDFAFLGAPAGDPDHDLRRDMIAQKMWDDYVGICTERGIDMIYDAIESDLDEDEDASSDDNDTNDD